MNLEMQNGTTKKNAAGRLVGWPAWRNWHTTLFPHTSSNVNVLNGNNIGIGTHNSFFPVTPLLLTIYFFLEMPNAALSIHRALFPQKKEGNPNSIVAGCMYRSFFLFCYYLFYIACSPIHHAQTSNENGKDMQKCKCVLSKE